jgi:hypothetical protein
MITKNDLSQSSPKAPLDKKKSIGDVVFDKFDELILNTPKKPREEKLAKLTYEQKQQLLEIEENAVTAFQGQLDELESALGMLRMGHHFGWKVLYLIHSKRTIRKYESILGDIRIRDIFPETGPSSYRSYGLALAEKFTNFWKVVGGDIKIPDRKRVDS